MDYIDVTEDPVRPELNLEFRLREGAGNRKRIFRFRENPRDGKSKLRLRKKTGKENRKYKNN